MKEDNNFILALCYYRDKAVQTLQAILHKYDVEVGEERTRELDELRSDLELQEKEFLFWKTETFEPQIILYVKNIFFLKFII